MQSETQPNQIKRNISMTLDIRALNRKIEEGDPKFRKLLWKEVCKRKKKNYREYRYWVSRMSFYMQFPEIRESAWRVFMNETKKNMLIFYNLISVYMVVPEFRLRIVNREMKEPEMVYQSLLCLIASDFPKFMKKVTKELERRFVRDSKLTRIGKFELLTIVRCGDYTEQLKLWAAKILVKEKENFDANEINSIYYVYANVRRLQ